MCVYTKEQVITLLNNYKSDCEYIALHYEMQHPVHITPDDMISALNFSHGDGAGTTQGYISDKTFYIAEQFRRKTDQMNCEVTCEIADRLIKLEDRVKRLEYYMTFLREEERKVINECFFEGHSLQKAAEALGVSVWTVRKLRDSAVESLVRKYSFVAGEK